LLRNPLLGIVIAALVSRNKSEAGTAYGLTVAPPSNVTAGGELCVMSANQARKGMHVSQRNIEITPSVTVHALLEAYPALEEVLIGIAPPFKKLKNPLLRKSVAKVATIKHISSVGGVPLDELIGKLREAVGQPKSTDSNAGQNYFGEQPDWYSPDKIALSFEEDQMEDKDRMTLTVILEAAKDVKRGEIVELVTSFLPAPGIDILKSKGYSVWTRKESDELFQSYFLKCAD
jgi:hypothetical protein